MVVTGFFDTGRGAVASCGEAAELAQAAAPQAVANARRRVMLCWNVASCLVGRADCTHAALRVLERNKAVGALRASGRGGRGNRIAVRLADELVRSRVARNAPETSRAVLRSGARFTQLGGPRKCTDGRRVEHARKLR